MNLNPRSLAPCALLALCFAPSNASAFVRTQTCVPNQPAHPYACAQDETPIDVFWPDPCVPYLVNREGTSRIEDFNAILDVIQHGFQTWTDVPCASFEAVYDGTTTDRTVGPSNGQPNGNIILFVDQNWRHAANIQALTSVSYRTSNGEIADADIEFNSERFPFGFVEGPDDNALTDFENTLTHEIGHFLGLDHTLPETYVGDAVPWTDATMFGSATNGEIKKRSLEADDQAGVCDIYPSNGDFNACTGCVGVDCPEQPDDDDDPSTRPGGCNTTAAGSPPAAFLAAAVALLAHGRRRRR